MAFISCQTTELQRHARDNTAVDPAGLRDDRGRFKARMQKLSGAWSDAAIAKPASEPAQGNPRRPRRSFPKSTSCCKP